MSYLLDTNACIAVLKGNKKLCSWMQKKQAAEFLLCSVVKAELLFGAHKSAQKIDNMKAVRTFCSEFECLPFDDQAAEAYGSLRFTLQLSGKPIGPNDLMIASIALAGDLALVTQNVGEFSRVPGLDLETW